MLTGLCLAAACWIGVRPSSGQELRGEPSPLTAWLDLRPVSPGTRAQTTPSWIESLDFIPPRRGASKLPLVIDHPGGQGGLVQGADPARSVYRLRLQRPAAAVNDLQIRVFFDDEEGSEQVYLSAWNELGTELMRSNPLGQGLGLPSSETLVVPMSGVDYLELSVPGDGTRVRAVFLTWLGKARVLQPVDFPATGAVREPFQVLSSSTRQNNDTYLYGVVTASLQGAEASVLKPETVPSATFEFQLEHQPLVAVISYEILGGSLGSAPLVAVNGRYQGVSDMHLPDLADPGYRGEQREASNQMAFRYTGWIRAQKVVPGEMLNAGLNSVTLGLSEGSSSVAVRSLQIQLKYNWEKLDYILAPASPPHETHAQSP